MKLSIWTKSQGLSYKTAWRLWKDGKLPVPSKQLLAGTVIAHPPMVATDGGVALYARVSSAGPKTELERQMARSMIHVAENIKRRGLHDSARLDNGPGAFACDGRRIRLPEIGWVKLREKLRFDGKLWSATLSRKADCWLFSFPSKLSTLDGWAKAKLRSGLISAFPPLSPCPVDST